MKDYHRLSIAESGGVAHKTDSTRAWVDAFHSQWIMKEMLDGGVFFYSPQRPTPFPITSLFVPRRFQCNAFKKLSWGVIFFLKA